MFWDSWINSLWNNSNWILAGVLLTLSIELIGITLWEYYLRVYLKKEVKE